MKRTFAITLILALLLALVAVPVGAQDRWDGADDLAVNPLACGMGDEMMDEGDDMEEDMEMMEYDGGMVA